MLPGQYTFWAATQTEMCIYRVSGCKLLALLDLTVFGLQRTQEKSFGYWWLSLNTDMDFSIKIYARSSQHYICAAAIICNICAYDYANKHSYMIVPYLSFRMKSIEVVSADLCLWHVTLMNLSTPVYIQVHCLFWWYKACSITWKIFFLSKDQGQASRSTLTLHEGYQTSWWSTVNPYTFVTNYDTTPTFQHIIINFLYLLKLLKGWTL